MAETSPRRRVVAAVVGAVALVAVAVGFPAWGWMSANAANDVQVVAGPGRANCTDGGHVDARTENEDGDPGVSFRLPGVHGKSCQVPISIRNDSGHTITVRDLTFPGMFTDKSRNHGGLVVTSDSSGVEARRGGDTTTAVIDVDEQIAPDESLSTLIRVEVNPYACLSAGVASAYGVPRVRFGVLGRDHLTSSGLSLRAKTSGAGLTWSGCP